MGRLPKALLGQRVQARFYPQVVKTTGVPIDFLELASGYFVYMLIANGRINFISSGSDPWEIALKLKRKFKADRIVYRQIDFESADKIVAALISKYNPAYNLKSKPSQLSELDAILGNSNACAA